MLHVIMSSFNSGIDEITLHEYAMYNILDMYIPLGVM